MLESFEEFLIRREKASSDYIRGGARAFMGIVAEHGDSTFMPPTDLVFDGTTETAKVHREGAQLFGSGSTGRFQIIQSGVSGELGYWTWSSSGDSRIQGQ